VKQSLFLLLAILTCLAAHAQNPKTYWPALLGSADTVWLIEHRTAPPHSAEFTADARIDPALIQAQKLLEPRLIDSLIMILSVDQLVEGPRTLQYRPLLSLSPLCGLPESAGISRQKFCPWRPRRMEVDRFGLNVSQKMTKFVIV